MAPASSPLARAQHLLAACWQAFCQAPQVRLGRWLTTETDRPLLHDYLLSLSASAEAVLQRIASPAALGELAATTRSGLVVGWLDYPGPPTETVLRAFLAGAPTYRLLVVEDQATQPLQRLARWFPNAVQTVRPAASAAGLLADIAGAAATQPAGRFQQHFHLLTTAISQADGSAVAAAAAACLAISRAEGWPLAEATVGLSGAHYHLAHKQFEEAHRYLAAALHSSEAAFEAGHAAAGTVSIQLWLSEAAAWQQQRQAKPAIVALRRALDRAQHVGAALLGVEAARQLGLALEHAGPLRQATACYEQGLCLAEQLPDGQRPPAVLRALGEAYLKCLRTAAERQALQARLHQLLNA